MGEVAENLRLANPIISCVREPEIGHTIRMGTHA